MAERIEALLKNEWEFYGEEEAKEYRTRKNIFALVLIPVLWIMLMSAAHDMAPDAGTWMNAFYATLFEGILILLFYLKLVQLDKYRGNWAGWYSSGMYNPDIKLKREEVISVIKNFLKSKGYPFHEKTHRTLTQWITYFTIPTADFRIRVWFVMVEPKNSYGLELAIGPETPLNKKLLADLRTEMSREFAERYR